jgi:hypothetical protein
LFLVVRMGSTEAAFVAEVDEILGDVSRMLKAAFLYDRCEQRWDGVTEHTWVERTTPPGDGGSAVGFVDDREVPARYVWVAGPDAELVELLWNYLRLRLPVFDAEDLKREAEDFERDRGALQRLAFGLNEVYDEAAASIIARALQSEQRSVRDSAQDAALLVKWPELLAPLRAALARESTEKGRRSLEYVISQVEQHVKVRAPGESR